MNARRSVGTILIGLAAFSAGSAHAQAVYRCGDNSYSQQPCEGGRPVRADDPRTPQQQLDAIGATRREADRADAMEQSRLQSQAQAERAVMAAERQQAVKQVAAPANDRPKPQAKPTHRPQVFVATLPRAKKNTKETSRTTAGDANPGRRPPGRRPPAAPGP